VPSFIVTSRPFCTSMAVLQAFQCSLILIHFALEESKIRDQVSRVGDRSDVLSAKDSTVETYCRSMCHEVFKFVTSAGFKSVLLSSTPWTRRVADPKVCVCKLSKGNFVPCC
jgi:hypothetical protein